MENQNCLQAKIFLRHTNLQLCQGSDYHQKVQNPCVYQTLTAPLRRYGIVKILYCQEKRKT